MSSKRGAVLAALTLGACTGQVSSIAPGTDDPDATPGAPDARPANQPDADPAAPDAAPPPDGRTGRYRCRGEALPTTAPAQLTFSGAVATVGLGGTTPRQGATVQVFRAGSSSVLGNATSDRSGNYSISAGTGGAPLDAFVRASAQGFADAEVIPAAPFVADATATSFLLATLRQLDQLAGLGGVQSRTPNSAVLSIGVVDCDGQPITGAKVSVAGGIIVYTREGRPNEQAQDTSSEGAAFVFNLPAGTVEITATADDGVAMRAHAVTVRGDVVTATQITP